MAREIDFCTKENFGKCCTKENDYSAPAGCYCKEARNGLLRIPEFNQKVRWNVKYAVTQQVNFARNWARRSLAVEKWETTFGLMWISWRFVFRHLAVCHIAGGRREDRAGFCVENYYSWQLEVGRGWKTNINYSANRLNESCGRAWMEENAQRTSQPSSQTSTRARRMFRAPHCWIGRHARTEQKMSADVFKNLRHQCKLFLESLREWEGFECGVRCCDLKICSNKSFWNEVKKGKAAENWSVNCGRIFIFTKY